MLTRDSRGIALQVRRTAAGLTQQELARRSGVNIRQIQRIEAGKSQMQNVTLGNALALAKALGVEAAELL